VLVRVRAASLHPDVWHVMRGLPYVLRLGAGLRRPRRRVPGTDLAGHVERVGAKVTRFRPGDEVFGESIKGYQWRNGGAFAEYAAAPEEALASKPANLTFEQAAAIPTSGLIAYNGLREHGPIRPGERVLVNGAGGGVGLFAVQLAKAAGAHVTGVDRSGKLDAIRSAGADEALDGTRTDFTRDGRRYDLILDVPGNHPFSRCRSALTERGTYVLIGHDHYGAIGHRWLGSLPRFARLAVMSPFTSALPRPTFSMPSKRDGLAALRDLSEAGKLTPVIDRTYPLTEVREAIDRLQRGNVRGKVVICP
jgi:NADPH:quinone reductase-like Zn-dependent oxidoreductase